MPNIFFKLFLIIITSIYLFAFELPKVELVDDNRPDSHL